MSISLATCKSVHLRRVFDNEATAFTPWLAKPENLAVLGEAVGMELELELTEAPVGPFYADIVCRDINRGQTVLIENQLEHSDHRHLGQAITYAVGRNAATVIWVARCIRDQHRAALDWLNGITPDRFQFFGVEVELLEISGSKPAPRFNVVSEPSAWNMPVRRFARRAPQSKSESATRRFEYWRAPRVTRSCRLRAASAQGSLAGKHYLQYSWKTRLDYCIRVDFRWTHGSFSPGRTFVLQANQAASPGYRIGIRRRVRLVSAGAGLRRRLHSGHFSRV
jgi:hypothetical protein